jgi:SOUL heme-binding protein
MTERQKFDLIKKIPETKVEVRHYHSCVKADVIVEAPFSQATSIGFRSLVTYISQNNVAMTAPVLQELSESNSWIVSFIMPEDMRIEDLPSPLDSKVTLSTVPEHVAAALPFSGVATTSKIQEKESELRAALTKEKLIPKGSLRIARFDPPWKIGFLRHNEVILNLES